MSVEAPTTGSVVSVDVHGLASGGAGVGRLEDGRTVFVPRAAPGERVRIRLRRVKPRWAEGELLEVLEPSDDRRGALCTRYDVCGGCQVQHLPEAVQRMWKARIVRDALERIGGFEDLEPPEVVASPRATGYRNRMSFTMRRLRGGRVVAGLHALDRPAHVVEIADECVLPEPEITRAWVALRRAWGSGAELLPAAGRLRLTVRRGADASVVLEVEGGEAGWDPAPLLGRVAALEGIVHRPKDEDGSAAPRSTPPGADAEEGVGIGFAQVNEEAAELLRAHVVARAADAERVVDAYCGAGPYGRPLAEAGAHVVGIELDPEAAAEARRGAPATFEVRVGSVEDLLGGALPADLLIVNPPRSGLDPAVVDAVLACPPDRMIYVSCDPATLARDLSGLKQRYELDGVRCFDLFPQTAHVETVVGLTLQRDI